MLPPEVKFFRRNLFSPAPQDESVQRPLHATVSRTDATPISAFENNSLVDYITISEKFLGFSMYLFLPKQKKCVIMAL